MSKDRNYSNGEITVHWRPDKCIHSGICAKGLSEVFDPRKRPWVNMDGATTERIVAQVQRCPSGALSVSRRNEGSEENVGKNEGTGTMSKAEVEITADGPILMKSPCTVTLPDGRTETRDKVTAFCRCGHSGNKPYCDGQHRKVGFKG